MIKTFTRKINYHNIHHKSTGFKPCAFVMCVVFFVFFFTKIAHAQTDTLSNWRTINITEISDTLTLDSLTVIPSTVTIKNKASGNFLDNNIFLITNNKLIFKEKIDAKEGLEINFRVFPFSLNAVASHKDTTTIFFGMNLSQVLMNYLNFRDLTIKVALRGVFHSATIRTWC